MLLLSVALAADLTWTCPELTSPEDAYPWSTPTELGTLDAIDAVIATAYAAIPEECLAACASTVDGYCEDVSCVAAAGDVVEWRYRRYEWMDEDHNSGIGIDLSFDVAPVGQTWTSVVGTYSYDYDGRDNHYAWGSEETVSAGVAWAGELRDGWPADGQFTAESGAADMYSFEEDSEWSRERWDDGACAWESVWSSSDLSGQRGWTVDVASHRVEVSVDSWGCPSEQVGTIDGVSVGVVEWADWSNSASDADDDGVSAGTYDCDDADPTINACVDDLYADGLDQDCDGADGNDADLDHDGFADVTYGGTDCDDRHADTFPGAPEGCDGRDNDCDGVIDDPVDDDADGFTSCDGDCDEADPTRNPGEVDVCDGIDTDCDGLADPFIDEDGDSSNACDGDCDDADPSAYPGAAEVADGVDNDCDGVVDDLPADSDSEDTGAGEGDSEAPEDTGAKATGCEGGSPGGCTTGGGSARSVAAVLVALAWGARRRARGGAR